MHLAPSADSQLRISLGQVAGGSPWFRRDARRIGLGRRHELDRSAATANVQRAFGDILMVQMATSASGRDAQESGGG